MVGQDQPQSNTLVTCGILIVVLLVCFGCLGFGSGGYYYRDNLRSLVRGEPTAAPELVVLTTTVVATIEVTPTVVPLPTNTPPATVTQEAPILTVTNRPVALPEPAASQYATLLVLEGNVFLLDYILQEVETGTMTEAEMAYFLAAVEQIFGTIRALLSSPLPDDTDPRLVQTWADAQNAFAVVDELTQLWSQGIIGPEDVRISLVPAQAKVQNALDDSVHAFEAIYNLDIETLQQGQVEAVREELMASAMAFAQNQAAGQTAAASGVQIEFSDSDIPLSDNLNSSVAWLYAGRILQLIPNFKEAQETIEELFDAQPNPFISDSRQKEFLFTISTIQASSRIIKQIELQSRMGQTRDLLLVALLDCDTAALYLASGYHGRSSDITVGLEYLESCHEKLVQPTAELEAFISNNETSGASETVEAAAVSACPTGCTELLSGCIIKGDVDEQGNKVYYLPGHPRYGEISIEIGSDDRWFCDISEAGLNGWNLPGS